MTQHEKDAISQQLSLLLPSELMEYIEAIARQEQTSKGWVIRKIIREHMKANKKGAK